MPSVFEQMRAAIADLKVQQGDPTSPWSKKEAQKQWGCEPCANPEVRELLIEAFPELRNVKAGLKELPPCEGTIPMRICAKPELPAPKRLKKKKKRGIADAGAAVQPEAAAAPAEGPPAENAGSDGGGA